ncbi:hypothetical protein AB1K91_17765 [Terribacillus sp. 179-K 1B1 HS]|uniref:hypothetical protein n=1 Tax=Terribacillus sp. 179-K 1B1 HS TaxID=3142388 RepID=UPI0039A0A26F
MTAWLICFILWAISVAAWVGAFIYGAKTNNLTPMFVFLALQWVFVVGQWVAIGFGI